MSISSISSPNLVSHQPESLSLVIPETCAYRFVISPVLVWLKKPKGALREPTLAASSIITNTSLPIGALT